MFDSNFKLSRRIIILVLCLMVALSSSGCAQILAEAMEYALPEVFSSTWDGQSYAGDYSSSASVYNTSGTIGSYPDDNRGETWTILLYLCGTDLESQGGYCTSNLVEAAKVNLPDNVKVIFQTGGTKKWNLDFVDSNYLERYRLLNQGDVERLDQVKRSSMGKQATLQEFLEFGVNNYPADKYGVIFWNHGGGMSGAEFDELYSFDSLTLDEIDGAFNAVNTQFEFIGFDACLMATLECALSLADNAKYFIASEEVEPGTGWNYEAMMQYIVDNPTCTGAELGKNICDTYMKKCGWYGDTATLSVTRLSQVHSLAKAFDEMAAEMTGLTEDVSKFRQLTSSIAKAENYGGNTPSEGYYNLVDIGDMVLHADAVLPNTGDKVLNALFNAVIYNVSGKARSSANGLATFYPLSASNQELSSYAKTAAFSKNYVQYLDASSRDWKAPSSFMGVDFDNVVVEAADVQSVSDQSFTVEASSFFKGENYALEIESGEEYIRDVYFSLYWMDYSYNEYMFLGRDDDMDYQEGLYLDNFRGVWPALNGIYVNLNLLSATESYNLYSIPIMLNGDRMNLRAIYDWDKEAYRVLGALAPGDNSGASSRDMRRLKDGDKVIIMMEGTNWETGNVTEYQIGSFTVKGAVTLEEIDLMDGDYLYQYELVDIMGETYYSSEVLMEVKGDEISLYETE